MRATTLLPLTPVQPDDLTTYANPNDVRRDVHALVGYVKGRTIKRTYRGNDLPQADYKRLAQLIPDDGLGVEATSGSAEAHNGYGAEAYGDWISYVDRLALLMGFVSYDTKGTYRGYSSAEPSFPDNIMSVDADAYRTFLALSLAEQEHRLLDTLVRDYTSSANEFYVAGVRGRLDRFSTFGSAIGVMAGLNFANIRRFLLDLLVGCAPGRWYSTAELVAYLKATHPFFLIPQKPAGTKHTNAVEKRYGNFRESDSGDPYRSLSIPDDAPDGFERVEGRYVERFLEGIPLTLGYVEVAYGERAEGTVRPSRGMLKAFRINERFLLAMQGAMPRPRVTVQPNFEIYIESALYPAFLINRLAPLSDVIREDTTTILKLREQKVAAHLADNPGLDVSALLRSMSEQDLPQNVAVELQEWARHADVFTLYDGFGVLESVEHHAATDAYVAERIGDAVQLVRDPGGLQAHLLRSGAIPLRIRHTDTAWKAVPAAAQTLFPRSLPAAQAPKKKARQAVTVQCEALIVLHVPDDALFEIFRKALLDARCVLDVSKDKRTLTLAAKDEAQIKELIKRLSDDYTIRVEDLP